MEGSEEDNVYTSNHGDLREQVRFLYLQKICQFYSHGFCTLRWLITGHVFT